MKNRRSSSRRRKQSPVKENRALAANGAKWKKLGSHQTSVTRRWWKYPSQLPVKSLSRFKSASKNRWCLISNPQFVKSHLNRSHDEPITTAAILLASLEFTKPHALYFVHRHYSSLVNLLHSLGEKYPPHNAIISGPCRGLVVAQDPMKGCSLLNTSIQAGTFSSPAEPPVLAHFQWGRLHLQGDFHVDELAYIADSSLMLWRLSSPEICVNVEIPIPHRKG